MSLGNNSNFTRERKVFNWSKFFTGVEKKTDGKLIYVERGSFLRFHKQKYKFYKIHSKTYNKLKIFAVIETILIVVLLIYLKSTISSKTLLELCIIFMSGALFDVILIFLRTKIVKREKSSRYEK